MHSLPESYRLALRPLLPQNRLAPHGGSTSKRLKPEDLLNFFIEEAQHHVMNAEHSKNGDSALQCMERKGRKENMVKGRKSKLNVTCDNCGKMGHLKPDCYSKVVEKRVRTVAEEVQEENQRDGSCSQDWDLSYWLVNPNKANPQNTPNVAAGKNVH